MGLFSRIAAPRAERTAASPSYSGLMGSLGAQMTSSGVLVNQSTAMSQSVVYACVRRRAQDGARCPGSLYVINPDGSTRTGVDDHPVARLFRRPNRAQTWFEFSEQMNVGFLLRGNAYAVVLRDGRGDPTEMIPINPDSVQVLEALDGSVFYQCDAVGLWQMSVLRGLPVAVPAEDVFHLRGLSFNSLVGVSTIGLAKDAIGVALGQEQQAARWMANGARPAGVLETDTKLSEDAAKRLKDRWDAFKSGIQNTGSTAVLEDGLKWKPMQLSSVDLEFINARNFQTPELCRFFGVPPHKIFVIDRAASMSIGEQNQDYANSTIAPDLERWEQKLEQYFGLDNERIHINFDEGQLLRADVMTRYQVLRVAILTGMLTPNEARVAEGMPPLPGGDVLLVPANSASLGSDMSGSASDGAGRPEGDNMPGPKVGTGGKQPGATELQPSQSHEPTMMRLADVPRLGARETQDPLTEPTATPPQQPLALTVNVDARGGVTKRSGTLRRNKDGSVGIEVVEEPAANEPEDGA